MQNENISDKTNLQVEVPVIEAEVVACVRTLSGRGWGSRRIASELGIARETVRRYVKGPAAPAGLQARPKGRRLDEAGTLRAAELWAKEAAGNAVVVRRLLAAEGYATSLRTVQRVIAPARAEKLSRDKATVRFETPPGAQLQIDFGQKLVTIAGEKRKVYFFVAVLGFSRRLFVMASLSERQEDWQEGVTKAFNYFGGSTQTLLIDNPKAMVLQNCHDGEARHVTLHPAFAAFCKDWDVVAKACAPRRARTKGKVENGVGYVKHNAIAGLSFTSFQALQAHLERWMHEADRRVHGTTKKLPIELFQAEERAAFLPLPQRPIPARTRRLKRKVANDCFVDIDTIRYSVPHPFVGTHVMVEVGDATVRIYAAESCIATHERCQEAHQRVVIPGHFSGLLRVVDSEKKGTAFGPTRLSENAVNEDDPLETHRNLDVYNQIVEGASL